jgi:hypothetical protein
VRWIFWDEAVVPFDIPKILSDLVEGLVKERRHRAKQVDDALLAINDAVVATRSYETTVRDSADKLIQGRRRPEEEARIGGLWNVASIRTQEINPQVASQLYIKALFWLGAFPMSTEEIVANKIDWNSVYLAINKLRSHRK